MAQTKNHSRRPSWGLVSEAKPAFSGAVALITLQQG